MKLLALTALSLAAFSATSAAPEYQIQGDMTEACPCNTTCPCHFGSNATFGHCEGVMAYHITRGNYGRTPLNGLTVLAMSWFGPNMKAAIGKMPARLYIDQRATPAQRQALNTIFGNHFKPMVGKVYPTRYIPIGVVNHGDYSTIKSPVLDLDIEPTKDAAGTRTKITGAPLALIPVEYIGESKRNRFNDPGLKKKWDISGRHANYGPFQMSSSDGMKKMEHASRG
jgi:hypothetical protein